MGFFSAIGNGLKSFGKSELGKVIIGTAAAAALAPLANLAAKGRAEQDRQLADAQYSTIKASPQTPTLVLVGIGAVAFLGGIVVIKALSK